MTFSKTIAMVFCLAIAWGVSFSDAVEPVNVIENGGFEDGMTGWQPAPEHSITEDPTEAHSGKRCLSGEVTGPQKALILKQRVKVRKGNRYEFDIWAKGTNRTKLVLWVVQPGAADRMIVGTWEKLTPQWRRYRAPLPVTADGFLELHVIAPSSHGAPAGRIWIDDIAVNETVMPPVVSISEDIGFNDEPAMAQTADGSIYTAWLSFRDGADSLQVARFAPKGNRIIKQNAWQVLGGKGTYVLGVTAAASGEKAAIAYAAESDTDWDIFAVECTRDGPGRPVAVTSDAAVDVDPSAAWSNETLWLAWESNRDDERRIRVASIQDGRASDSVAISAEGVSACDPSIAVLESGEVCVAWHGFSQGSYDIFLARRSTDGTWTKPRRLTNAPTIDRHAILAARGDALWLLYENAQCLEYRVGATNQRRLLVAKVTIEGLMAPNPIAGDCPLTGRCEAGSMAFDSTGGLWIAMLRPRLPRAGWDVFLTGFINGKWQTPMPISIDKGLDRRPALAVGQGRATIVYQSDDIPRSWNDLDLTSQATSNIFLASIDLNVPTQPGAITLEPLVESDEPFEAAEIRIARGEDLPTQSIDYEGKSLKLYFGQLHEHTDISVCNRTGDQSVDETYQNMRDIIDHDFACATDHGYNINPYIWNYLAKLARTNDDPDRFLTFLGEEWTSTFEEYSTKHPYGFYGHRNLIFADSYFPRWFNARNRQTPAQVWEDLRKLNANFVQIPHQLADTGNVPTDWDFTDEVAQPVAEIFQVRGSYEYKGTPREANRSTPGAGYFLQDAWARGIVIGVIASPDHGGGYGKACVFAPELTREAILDAIRRRRCYGTTAAKIFLDVRVNGHLMGEKVATAAGKAVTVEIDVRCPADIDRIEVCRNNRFIYTKSPEGRSAKLTFVDREPLAGRSDYYVRVIQKDEEIAWSSPVWFAAE